MKDIANKASVTAGILLLASLSTSGAFAQSLDDRSYATIDECKTYVGDLRQQEIEKLNKRKQMMGAGMPDSIYSRKKGKIEREYQDNVTSCESLVTSTH
ncbi:MAG: hypothetical protein HUJ31_05930 [Pseudomonadales bacterium]|nr:hypothetical protein [Pseudomonadales bacterium]